MRCHWYAMLVTSGKNALHMAKLVGGRSYSCFHLYRSPGTVWGGPTISSAFLANGNSIVGKKELSSFPTSDQLKEKALKASNIQQVRNHSL
jgi:hypothetical protein